MTQDIAVSALISSRWLLVWILDGNRADVPYRCILHNYFNSDQKTQLFLIITLLCLKCLIIGKSIYKHFACLFLTMFSFFFFLLCICVFN